MTQSAPTIQIPDPVVRTHLTRLRAIALNTESRMLAKVAAGQRGLEGMRLELETLHWVLGELARVHGRPLAPPDPAPAELPPAPAPEARTSPQTPQTRVHVRAGEFSTVCGRPVGAVISLVEPARAHLATCPLCLGAMGPAEKLPEAKP